MSIKRLKEQDPGTVAQSMEQVRWDYAPGETDSSMTVPAAAFFREFPWDSENGGNGEPAPAKPGRKQ